MHTKPTPEMWTSLNDWLDVWLTLPNLDRVSQGGVTAMLAHASTPLWLTQRPQNLSLYSVALTGRQTFRSIGLGSSPKTNTSSGKVSHYIYHYSSSQSLE